MVNANRSGSSHPPPATLTIQGTIVTDPTVLPPSPLLGPGPPGLTGPVLDLSAVEVDFGLTGTQLVVQARNAGVGTLTVISMTASPVVGPDTNWLDVTLLTDGKTMQLTADRTAAADGPYQAQVDVVTTGGSGSFLVDLTVGGTTPTPIGPVIVDVIAADGVTRVARVTTTAAEGYAWTVPDLPPGQYFLEAGVDLDSNGVIGEPGEPFGAYPSAATEEPLEAEQLTNVAVDLLVQ
jgi:serine protease